MEPYKGIGISQDSEFLVKGRGSELLNCPHYGIAFSFCDRITLFSGCQFLASETNEVIEETDSFLLLSPACTGIAP